MDEIKIGAHEIYLAPENITLEKLDELEDSSVSSEDSEASSSEQ